MPISFETIPTNARASGLFVEVQQAITGISNANFIPQQISLVGQYDPAKTTVVDYVPKKIESADQAASLYGFGSMLHLETIKVFAGILTSGIPVYAHPVPDDGAAVASDGTITATGAATSAGTLFFYIANQQVQVNIEDADTGDDIAIAIAAAITAKLTLPVTAAVNGVTTEQVDITSKWKGISANDIDISVNLEGDVESSKAPSGTTIAIVAMANGATNPDITSVFTNMGDNWFTRLVFPYDDSANLVIMEAAGVVRFQPDIRRFFLGFVGSIKVKADYIAQVAARNSNWTTFVPAHNSVSLPFEVAAACVGVSTLRAQADPARPSKGLALPGIRAGYEIDPYTYSDKNDMTIAGGSVTYIDAFGNVRILDLNTTTTTNDIGGEVAQWARRIIAWSNNQAKVFSLEALLTAEPFVAAKIVSNDAVTSQQYAISPVKLKGYLIGLVDGLWMPQAWSKNRDEIINGIITEIDSGNPERLNAQIADDQAVGLRILAVLYQFVATSNA